MQIIKTCLVGFSIFGTLSTYGEPLEIKSIELTSGFVLAIPSTLDIQTPQAVAHKNGGVAHDSSLPKLKIAPKKPEAIFYASNKEIQVVVQIYRPPASNSLLDLDSWEEQHLSQYKELMVDPHKVIFEEQGLQVSKVWNCKVLRWRGWRSQASVELSKLGRASGCWVNHAVSMVWAQARSVRCRL